MKSAGPLKHFVAAFVIAVAGYFATFYAIEHYRAKDGPWVVTFNSSGDGPPGIVVEEVWLNIAHVKIIFPGQTAPATNAVMVFNQPQEVPYPVPFGNCVFMDSQTLPGTVTFEMFGHEIELRPRFLGIDRKEQPWKSNTTIELKP